ncbi:hypothetical protein X777_07728 [Ooceraea biroi]|uniref:Uncharacterized protein n=1 Tax=Ooceraea biroi TaxID=2015173 RepID=A0A026WZ99_OOCBI|nr:hypothetical protein X777_07728 [Ooceraea biroi]
MIYAPASAATDPLEMLSRSQMGPSQPPSRASPPCPSGGKTGLRERYGPYYTRVHPRRKAASLSRKGVARSSRLRLVARIRLNRHQRQLIKSLAISRLRACL